MSRLLSSLLLPPVIRRPAESGSDPYAGFPLWEGNHVTSRVNSSQEPARGLFQSLSALLGFVALHERNLARNFEHGIERKSASGAFDE